MGKDILEGIELNLNGIKFSGTDEHLTSNFKEIQVKNIGGLNHVSSVNSPGH